MTKKTTIALLLLAALTQPSPAQDSITESDFKRIKEYQSPNDRQCNPEKVIQSSSNLGVDALYSYNDEDHTPLNEKTDKRLLCLISISTYSQIKGHLNSHPHGPMQHLKFESGWPQNAIVEEIMFGPPKKFNLRCDDDGVPSVIIKFTKKNGKLVRSISFITSVLDCGTGELDNWLKPRPAWLK